MTNIDSLKNVMVEPVSGSIEYESLDGYKCEVQVVIKPDNHIELNARNLFKTDLSCKPIYSRFGLNIDWDLVSIDDINEAKLWNTVNELVEALYECRNDEGSERYKGDFQYRKFVQQAMCIQSALDSQRPEDDTEGDDNKDDQITDVTIHSAKYNNLSKEELHCIMENSAAMIGLLEDLSMTISERLVLAEKAGYSHYQVGNPSDLVGLKRRLDELTPFIGIQLDTEQAAYDKYKLEDLITLWHCKIDDMYSAVPKCDATKQALEIIEKAFKEAMKEFE